MHPQLVTRAIPPGLFGKMPGHGDFVRRGLASAFVSAWDQWLQQCIAGSRERLGSRWLEHYLVAPIWRFSLSPGLCGSDGWCGVLMPSVDRTNRHFPLTLALTRNADLSPLAASTADNAAWFDRLEAVARSALSIRVDADTLVHRLADLTLQSPGGIGIRAQGIAANGDLAWHFELPPNPGPNTAQVALTAALLRCIGAEFSLWWTPGYEQVQPTLLLRQGLPTPDDFTAMLHGRWHNSTWDTFQALETAAHRSPDSSDTEQPTLRPESYLRPETEQTAEAESSPSPAPDGGPT